MIGVKKGKIWGNIDSFITNRLFQKEYTAIPSLQQYRIIQSEYTFGNSRFDFLMKNIDTLQKALVEVKSVTLVKNGVAFPDAPTIRGSKHLNELIRAIEIKEYQSFIIFVVKRNDICSFKPNKVIDPHFFSSVKNSYSERSPSKRCKMFL